MADLIDAHLGSRPETLSQGCDQRRPGWRHEFGTDVRLHERHAAAERKHSRNGDRIAAVGAVYGSRADVQRGGLDLGHAQPVQAGDEVAFFPPVTGG